MTRVLLLSILLFAVAFAHYKGPSASSVSSSIECGTCIATAAFAGQAAKIKATEGAILQFAKVMCKLFAKVPSSVCDGMVDQFRDEFFYVFRRLADQPTRICAALITGCGDPTDPLGEGWEIPLPPLPKTRSKFVHRPPSSSSFPSPKSTLRVLHLTDIHIDYLYKEGSEAECVDPVCCRFQPNKSPNAKNIVPAGYWGTIGKCDIPYRTFDNMLRHISRSPELNNISYIMVGGDLINHVDWKYSWEGHIEVLRNISSLIKGYFPSLPIYWALGNHEGVPVNSFPTHQVDNPDFLPTKLYEELTAMNRPFVKEDSEETSLFRGSWSAVVTQGLRLISINTGFCINTNFFLYLNQSDPDGSMSWFAQELLKSEQAGEKVHVLAHIPPGYSDCLEGWSRNYYRVIQRFSSTITGQFFGHVHWDYFTLFYQDMYNVSSPAVGVAYMSPSVTTFDYLNPAFRIYTIDADNDFNVVEHENYMADLTKTDEHNPPNWELLYSARQQYNMTSLSPQEWSQVSQSLFESPALQERFLRLSFRTEYPSCDSSCLQSLLCLIRSGHHDDSLYCPPSMLLSNRVH